jgi:hypothetical protein
MNSTSVLFTRSRWLGICFCVTLVPFTFSQDRRYICNLRLFIFVHDNKNKVYSMIILTCLFHTSWFVWMLRSLLLYSRRYVLRNLRPRFFISRRDITFGGRRTLTLNIFCVALFLILSIWEQVPNSNIPWHECQWPSHHLSHIHCCSLQGYLQQFFILNIRSTNIPHHGPYQCRHVC